MNILEIGIEKGIEKGSLLTLVKNVESAMKNMNTEQQKACEVLGVSVEEYESAKRQITAWKKPDD